MNSSIQFVRPADSALSELRAACGSVGAVLSREEEVNKGVGVKVYGTFGTEPISILLYYNRGKGISSRIVFEKMPEGAKDAIVAGLSSPQNTGVQKRVIPIFASFDIVDHALRSAIRQNLSAAYPNLKVNPKQTHMDYFVKIASAGNELTITQFKSGSLLLQGSRDGQYRGRSIQPSRSWMTS